MTEQHAAVRRVAVNTFSNVAGQAVVVLTLLALAPIIVHSVGATDYGVWIVIGSVASLGFLLELGISSALVKYVAEHAAHGDTAEAARMVAAGVWLYAILGVAVLSGGLLVAFVVPEIFHLHGALSRLMRPLAALTALDVAVSIVAIAPLAVLRGLQRFPLVNGINGVGAISGLILTIAALLVGTGIIGVAAVGALNSLLTYAASLLVARRIAPDYVSGRMRWDRERVPRLFRFSRSVAAIQVAIQLQSKLDAIVIAGAAAVRLVTPYNFAQRLATGTSIAGDQFGKVLLPLATEVGVKRDAVALRRVFLTALRLTLAIALAVGLPVSLLGGPLLGLWVGHRYSGYGTVVALLAVAAMIDLPSGLAGYVLQSIERHGPVAWMALGSGIANVGMSIAFVGPYGIKGVAAATLIASAVEITIFVLPYTARVLGISLREFATAALFPLVLPGLVLSGVLVGGRTILPIGSLLHLVLVTGAALLAFAASYLTLGAAMFERSAYRAAAGALLRVPGRVRAARSNSTDGS